MSIRDELQSELSDAFDDDLQDAVFSIKLIKGKISYDVSTGTNIKTGDTFNTRGIPYDINTSEIFNQALKPGDVSFIILQNELDSIPEIDDYINYNGYTYKIIDVSKDPADATWEILCRK
jgi:hypothetical protein